MIIIRLNKFVNKYSEKIGGNDTNKHDHNNFRKQYNFRQRGFSNKSVVPIFVLSGRKGNFTAKVFQQNTF